jgi:hypothetical protein
MRALHREVPAAFPIPQKNNLQSKSIVKNLHGNYLPVFEEGAQELRFAIG